MNSHVCLSDAEMRQWLADSATNSEDSSLDDRINECPKCQSLAESLLASEEAALRRTAVTILQNFGRAESADQGHGPADYELLEKLGEGGMGVVSKACQRGLGRLVALKTLRPEYGGVAWLRQRFQREAEAVGRLQHPSIVQIFEVGERGGEAFFAMEFVEGGTLKDRLKDGPLPISEGVRLVAQAARAVHHAHQRRIIHLDLKPGNILLAPASGRDPMTPKVADFGLARHVGDDGVADLTVLSLGAGTPAYMAPEQAAGEADKVSAASDIYALGAVLYEVLTGRPPFVGKSQGEILDQLRNAEPTPPSRLRRGIASDLDTVCLKCLSKEPADRYASALELADDLERTLRHEPIRARVTPPWERLGKWVRRHPALAATAATLALVVLAVATVAPVLAYVFNQQAAKEREAREEGEKDFRFAQATMARFQQALRDANQDDALRDHPAVERFGRDLVRHSLDYHEGFLARRGGDPAFAAETAEAWFHVGLMRQYLGRTADAIAAYHEAADRFAQLPPASGSQDPRRDRAGALANVGTLYIATGKPGPARAALDAALAIRTALAAEGVNDPDFLSDLAATHHNLGILHRDLGDPAAEDASIKKAVALRAQLVTAHPDVARYRADLAYSEVEWARTLLRRRQDLDQAEAVLKGAIKRLTPPADRPALDARTAGRLADAQYELGEVYRARQQSDLAEKAHLAALSLREKLRDRGRGVVALESAVAHSHNALAGLAVERRDWAKAEANYGKALEVRKRLAEADRDNLILAIDLAGAHSNLGNVRREKDTILLAALGHFNEADRILTPIVDQADGRYLRQARQYLMKTLFGRARTYEGMVPAMYGAARRDMDRALALSPGSGMDPLDLWSLKVFQAVVLARLREYDAAGKEALALEAEGPGRPGQAVELARVFALCAPRREADDFVRRAVAQLTAASRDGQFDSDEKRKDLAADPDFAALHGDDQFQHLVRGTDRRP